MSVTWYSNFRHKSITQKLKNCEEIVHQNIFIFFCHFTKIIQDCFINILYCRDFSFIKIGLKILLEELFKLKNQKVSFKKTILYFKSQL